MKASCSSTLCHVVLDSQIVYMEAEREKAIITVNFRGHFFYSDAEPVREHLPHIALRIEDLNI